MKLEKTIVWHDANEELPEMMDKYNTYPILVAYEEDGTLILDSDAFYDAIGYYSSGPEDPPKFMTIVKDGCDFDPDYKAIEGRVYWTYLKDLI